ncbi:hypothetical protein H2248_002400 [Termitomyces sp. 'cryptogamus']|nr:hypothetical protein H2248_002399 [Termitomyces sp. 'cryptogamus']KAH0579547.1 hypothetical protein H2248_002400 [Termitomyces sp. 'cryptogamus']
MDFFAPIGNNLFLSEDVLNVTEYQESSAHDLPQDEERIQAGISVIFCVIA